MRTDDFDFDLPEELIAQHPPPRRDDSRMMVIDRGAGEIAHRRFCDFPGFVRPGDLVVLNDTRVKPARFFSNDGRIELLRLDAASPTVWRCLVRPGKRMRVGHRIQIGAATGTVREILPGDGARVIEFDGEVDEARHGHLALPPYIERADAAEDSERYQTVFAREPGAIAAPTAGLHFTAEILAGLPHAFLTLHVGVGTFQPVRAERVEDHLMHREWFSLSAETALRIERAERVIAVGTTVTRVLEHCAREGRDLEAQSGETGIFIHPPYRFRRVGALLTNFHLPKSTLLMLVSAFAGRDLIREAYRQAIAERYRFYSYGDCMLIV